MVLVRAGSKCRSRRAPEIYRLADSVLRPLANDIELPLELRFIEAVAGDEQLPHEGLGAARHGTDRIALDRHIAPTQEPRALLADNSGNQRLALLPPIGLRREKQHPDTIFPSGRQAHPDIAGGSLEKVVRHLQQNPGAVSRAGVATLRSSVTEAFKDLQPLLHNRMGFLALDVDDKADAAGVLLLLRVVEALLRWKPRDAHRSYLVKKVGV